MPIRRRRAPARAAGAAALFTAVSILGHGPALADPPVLVKPGETFYFGTPGFDNGCETFPAVSLPPGSIVDCTPNSITPGTDRPLRSTVRVQKTPFGRAKATFFQFNDIELDAGNRPDTLLMAQISGNADIRGFLVLIGLGKVETKLVAKVFDITDGEVGAPVVKTHTIAKYEVKASFQALSGFGLNVEGGAPYLGVSGGKLFNFSLEMKKDVVRDDVSFGFDVLIRRGHVYRVQLQLESEAKCGGLCPLAIARFFTPLEDIAADVPRLFDPELWKDTLGIDADGLKLPNFAFGDSKFSFFKDALTANCDDKNGDDKCSMTELLAGTFDWPINVGGSDGVVSRILDKIGVKDKLEESIPFPGTQITNLSVTVQEDEIEAIEDAAIEDKIAACISTVRLYLPAEFGGKLERVTGLVEALIQKSEAAGLRTGRARDSLEQARDEALVGNYKRSYQDLCKAYDYMANFSTGKG